MRSSHPFDETCEAAALYALGSLSQSESERFEQRLRSGCPLCLAELENCQEAAELMLLATDAVEPDPGLEARLLARIGAPSSAPAKPLAQPKILRAGEGRWRTVAPGVQARFLHQDKTMLVRMDPGSTYPSHPHALEEQCLMLEGSVLDTEGNQASAGDFIVMTKGTTHPPIFTEEGALFLITYS